MKKIFIAILILVVLVSALSFALGFGVKSIRHIDANNPLTIGTVCKCAGFIDAKFCSGCERCIGFEFGCKQIEDMLREIN